MAPALNTDPYWWEAAPLPEPAGPALARDTDVAVVGAGYAGLSAALTLARAGRRVRVFDKDRPGEGASSRNGGIASGSLRISFSEMIARMGLERAKAIYGEGKRAREDLARFVDAEGIDCDFSLAGRFGGAVRPAHYERMAREAELMRRHLGIASYAVPKAEQHRELGTDFYHGGVVRPDIGGLHPGRLHAGMLAAASAAGAVVHGRTAVTGIRREGRGFEVRTDRGTVAAAEVLVCTNGYTDGATPWLRRRLVPVPSQIIATAPLMPEVMGRLMPKRRMVGESRNVYHYFRPSPDGTRIIFGGRRGAGSDDPAVECRHLRRDLIEIFPELEAVAITHSWWGYVAYSFDFLPKLAVRDGVHYAAGFCGSGVVWARWLGRKAALRILGDADAKTVFDEMPFTTRPLYTGRPWFLPAVLGWHRLKDRLGM